MGKMSQLSVLVIMLLGVSVSGLWAQDEKSQKKDRGAFNPEKFIGGSLQTLKEKLGLSEEQVAKLKGLIQEAQKRFEEIRAKAEDGDRETMREEFQDLRTDIMEKARALLTEDQKMKLKELAEGMRRDIGNRMRGGLMNLKLLHEKLNLTEEQENEIKEILKDVREEAKRIREENQGDEEKMREAMKGVMDRIIEDVKSVLTEEQKKALDELRKEWQEKRGQDHPHKDGEKN